MWEKTTALAALFSVLISIYALYITKISSEENTKIAIEALQTSRQSNDIALGLNKELPIIKFTDEDYKFDFTNKNSLDEDFKQKVLVKNTGKIAIDGLSIEVIGIEPFTYPLDTPSEEVKPLPSFIIDVKLNSTLQPDASALIDIRLVILKYLEKFEKTITDKDRKYSSTINVILLAKTINSSLPSSGPSKVPLQDRQLFRIIFKQSIVNSKLGKELLKKNEIMNRVFPPGR